MCVFVSVGGWACACVGGERFSNSNRIIPSDYRILLLLKMPIPNRNLMSAMVPDLAIELTGFSVHRSDRTKELTGKSRGGGVCFYINNSWCDERNIHSTKSFCSPDLEFHMLLCRPFWLPREFTAIIITAVYIPPQANTDQALKEHVREYK